MRNRTRWKKGRPLLRLQESAAILLLVCGVSLFEISSADAGQRGTGKAVSASTLSSTTPGQPVWAGDVAVATAPGDQAVGNATGPGVAIVPDGSGGAIISWEDDTSGNIHAQRVDSTGKPLWTSGGVVVAPSSGFEMSPRAVNDGVGGAIITWVDGRFGVCDPGFQGECNIFAQRLDPSGSALWAAGGVSVTSAPANQGTSGIAIASDGQGGAIFGWEDSRNICCTFFVQRINATGIVQWPTDGVQVSPNPSIIIGPVGHAPAVVSDGAGGAYVAWLNVQVNPVTQFPNLSIQRLDANGNILFAASGIAVLDVIRGDIGLVNDSTGGAILAGNVRDGDGFGDISAQRIAPTGSFLWGAQGVSVVAARYVQQDLQMVSDDNGGAIVVWEDQRNNTTGTSCSLGPGCDIFAQRLDTSGAALWQANGLPISLGLNGQVLPRVVGDGNGGAVFAWQDCRQMSTGGNCDFTRDLAAQRVSGTGTPMWAGNGIAVTSAPFNQGLDYGTQEVPSFVMTTDTTGGAILAWPDGRSNPCPISAGARECDVYTQRVSDQFGPAPAADLSLQMSVSPSPAPLGSNLTYVITVTNNGPNTARGVNLLDVFPGFASFVSISPSQGGCVFSAGFVGPLCGLGPLTSGSKASVSLVIGTTDNYGTFTNTATVYSGEADQNAANSAATASAIVAVDFTLSSSSGSKTVTAGQPASYTLTVTPLVAILNDTVTFSCSGLPARSSCAFSPSTLVPGANPTNATVTISTTAATAALSSRDRGFPLFAFTFPVLALALARVSRRPGWRVLGRMSILVMFMLLPGCGGGGGGGGIPGTASGTYTVTLTAATSSLTHAIQVTLVVQ